MPRISLAFVAPGAVRHPLMFERPLPLAAGRSPASRPPSSAGHPSRRLARRRPVLRLGRHAQAARLLLRPRSRRARAPGRQAQPRRGIRKVRERRRPAGRSGQDHRRAVRAPAGLPGAADLAARVRCPDASRESVNMLIHLAVSMRAHGRGGALLVVPRRRGTGGGIHRAARPVRPRAAVRRARRADALARPPGNPGSGWVDALRRAVDGRRRPDRGRRRHVITDQYELLAFGAKIVRRDGIVAGRPK